MFFRTCSLICETVCKPPWAASILLKSSFTPFLRDISSDNAYKDYEKQEIKNEVETEALLNQSVRHLTFGEMLYDIINSVPLQFY